MTLTCGGVLVDGGVAEAVVGAAVGAGGALDGMGAVVGTIGAVVGAMVGGDTAATAGPQVEDESTTSPLAMPYVCAPARNLMCNAFTVRLPSGL
jgi:hypothetical protein